MSGFLGENDAFSKKYRDTVNPIEIKNEKVSMKQNFVNSNYASVAAQ